MGHPTCALPGQPVAEQEGRGPGASDPLDRAGEMGENGGGAHRSTERSAHVNALGIESSSIHVGAQRILRRVFMEIQKGVLMEVFWEY